MAIKLRTKFSRAVFFLIGDAFSIIVGFLGANLIFNLAPFASINFFKFVYPYVLLSLFIGGLAAFKMYSVSWRYTSLRDLVRIFQGIISGFVAFLGLYALLGGLSNQVIIFSSIVFINSLLLIGVFRISRRLYWEVFRNPASNENVIIFGAGNACDQILRDIMRNNNWKLHVSAIFDDDESLNGVTMHGVKVHGNSSTLCSYLKNYFVSQLIVAAPSIPKKRLKEIIDKVKKISPDLKIKVIPSFHRLSDDPVGVKNIRDIRIEDILGREPARVDIASIQKSIEAKRVLITGAGGSIGSEIIRQCSKLNPQVLIAVDIDETELYRLENEMDGSIDCELITLVGDVSEEYKMETIFQEYTPDIIFHAAAYKHVPMMERFPEEAIKVNVKGTQIISSLSCKYEVEKFVLISTDKAVNPTNVMGATKQLAEQICMAFNDFGVTKFISVRFGNVLGSRGSVVPLFMNQIEKGGPVTITDPEITRYFMTIPEAVLLVMQAGSMGKGGEVFVLDMGEPVKILDMAKELIRLNGLKPEIDISLEFRGLRPGEKMFEELLNNEEGAQKTIHPQIYKADCNVRFSAIQIDNYIDSLLRRIIEHDYDALRDFLKKGVPTYMYNGELKKIAKTKAGI